MNLLLRQTKLGLTAVLVEDFDEAVRHAQKHVGDHYPEDGCSSPRTEQSRVGVHGKEFHAHRSTSFGLRSATVVPIGTDFEARLVI